MGYDHWYKQHQDKLCIKALKRSTKTWPSRGRVGLVNPHGFSPPYRCLHVQKGKCIGDTVRWIDWQDIGEECTQCQWRWEDRWCGSDCRKHELLGRMHVDVCEGKFMED